MKANIASQIMQTIRTNSSHSSNLSSLKPGQMVMGKVLKLFPGQRAMIQIGNQQMNAQLEAALNLNGRYMFQVESAEDLVHLKVLGDAPTAQGEKAASSLLSQLGMSYGKDRASFVGQLIKQNIPFQQSELKQAIPLMEKYSASQETKNVLLEMMNRKLPMKESVFLAMRERMGSSPTLTSSLQSLNTAQNQSVDGTQSMLRSLNQPGQSFSEKLISILGDNTKTQSSSSYSLMQKAQLVPSNQSQTNWQAQVKSWVSNTTNEASGGPSLQQAPLSQTNEEMVAKRMVDLFQKQLPISKGNQQSLKTLSENLSRLVEGTNATTETQNKAFQQVKQTSASIQQEGILNKLSAHLEQQGVTKEALRQFLNRIQGAPSLEQAKQTVGSMKQIVQALQDVSGSQLTKQESRTLLSLLSSVQQDYPSLLPVGKDYFLTQLKTVLQQSGLNYEHQLMKQPDGMEAAKQEMTLKASVLQGLQESLPSQVSDKLSSVLNHLNGMVLSVQDSDQTLQMNLQLPGNWFGIEQDLHMDIEGRKNDQDEVDPDYCHILFYLQLQSLDETVIDMRIQKRIVQLSLYTDNEQVESLIKSFKPMLEEGLEKLDYTLSTVRHRPMQEQTGSNESALKQRYSSPQSKGGVDFRI